MSDVFIIDAVRTPIGAYLGNYKKTESVELGTSCLKELFDRNQIIPTHIHTYPNQLKTKTHNQNMGFSKPML